MTLTSPRRALVIPGRGESVGGLRASLAAFDQVDGIDFNKEFAQLGFGAQVGQVSALITGVHPDETVVVGRSFGAWLVLHALLGCFSGFDGTVLLLAPVLGYGSLGRGGFMAPRASAFWKDVEAGLSMPATRVVLMAGTADAQCPLEWAHQLAKRWPLELHECPVEHGLGAWTSMEMGRRIGAALRRDSTFP